MSAEKIEQGRVVSLAFDLCDENGEIIEASDISGVIAFVHGRGAIIPGLDKRLIGMKVGDEADFSFGPEEAFGTGDNAPTKIVRRSEFPAGAKVEVGESFEAGIPGGQKIRLLIDQIHGDQVTVKMLHPLAGQTVTMSVKVLALRPATPLETQTGKVVTKPPPPPPRA